MDWHWVALKMYGNSIMGQGWGMMLSFSQRLSAGIHGFSLNAKRNLPMADSIFFCVIFYWAISPSSHAFSCIGSSSKTATWKSNMYWKP